MHGLRLLAAITAVLLLGTPARGDTGCGVADSLRLARALGHAQAGYVELLKYDPALSCARAGVEAVARERAQAAEWLERGLALEHAGLREEARSAFIQAAMIAPGEEPVTRVLQRVLAPTSDTVVTREADPYASVRTLAGAGLHADALAALRKVAGEHPHEPVPEELHYLTGHNVPGWSALGRTDTRLVLGFLLLAAALAWRRWGTKPHLTIEELGGSASGASTGKGFASMVEDRLRALTDGAAGGNVHLVTGPIETVPVPATVQTAIPPTVSWITALPALASWLLPRRVLTLSGHLHWTAEQGAGITLALKERGRIIASVTTWEREYGPVRATSGAADPSAYHSLAEPAAIWILFALATYRGDTRFSLLGTRRWRSYALFRAGVRLETAGSDALARQRYHAALRFDPEIRGVRVNLATILSEHGDNERALPLLERVLQEIRETPGRARDPVYYSALYRLASIHFNMGHPGPAAEVASELVTRIGQTLTALSGGPTEWRKRLALRRDENLREYLESIRPSAELLHAGVSLKLPPETEGHRERLAAARRVVERYHSAPNTPHTHYNLACVCSTLVQTGVDGSEREKLLDRAIFHLRYYMLLDGRAVGWASQDPSLQSVREDELTRDRFRELLDARAAPEKEAEPAQRPLGQLALIGALYSERLAKEGIHSPDDLHRKASTPEVQRHLGEKIGVTPRLVRRWVGMAELMQLEEMGAVNANLLLLANVRSLQALRRQSPERLASLLSDLRGAAGLDGEAPDVGMVTRWIRQAREIGAAPAS